MKKIKLKLILIILSFSLILTIYGAYHRYGNLKNTVEIQNSIFQLVALKSANAEWNIELNKIHSDNFIHYDLLNDAALKYEKEMLLFLSISSNISASIQKSATNLLELSLQKKKSMNNYLSEVAIVRNSLNFLDTSLFILYSEDTNDTEIIKFLYYAQYRLSTLIASNQSIQLKEQNFSDYCNDCNLKKYKLVSSVNQHLDILKRQIQLSHNARSDFYNIEHEQLLTDLFEQLSSLYTSTDLMVHSLQSQVLTFSAILVVIVTMLSILLYWLYRSIEVHRTAGVTDSLTGLHNRKRLFDDLTSLIPSHKKSKVKLGLLFIDLDGFKKVNDTHGHEIGDKLLKLLSERLMSNVRKDDLIYRIGGDEFIVLLQKLPTSKFVESIVENLLVKCNKPYLINNISCNVTLSIGISISPDHTEEVNELLKYADEAMYSSKRKGKGRFIIWSNNDYK